MALVVLAVILVRPSEILWDPFVESIRDTFGSQVEADDPIDTSVSHWIDGPSTSLEYAMRARPSETDHILIQSTSIPDGAIPISSRADILVLQGPDVDEKVSLVGVSTAGWRESEPYSGARIAVNNGRGDSFPRSYSIDLDLVSGTSRGLDGEQILDNGSADLPRGDSVLLVVSADAPGAKTYSWVVRLDLATESGQLISRFVDAKGNHFGSVDEAMENPFEVTGTAEQYLTSYELDEIGQIHWTLLPEAGAP